VREKNIKRREEHKINQGNFSFKMDSASKVEIMPSCYAQSDDDLESQCEELAKVDKKPVTKPEKKECPKISREDFPEELRKLLALVEKKKQTREPVKRVRKPSKESTSRTTPLPKQQ
jgi:hypothetical protein